MKRVAVALVRKALGLFGVEVRKFSASRRDQRMADFLGEVVNRGFRPATVIDVGAARGTQELYEAFPEAFHVLVEPLREFEAELAAVLTRYRGVAVQAAAASEDGPVELNVHEQHLVGSSLLREKRGEDADGVPRTVMGTTLDTLRKEHELRPPFLLKVDVQGAELDVLAGAPATLAETELVLMEVSLFQFMGGGPQFYDVVSAMHDRGFAAYDVFGGLPRPLDGALGQLDMAFVKESGLFRQSHAYATTAQWEALLCQGGRAFR